MHIDVVPHRGSTPTVLLRASVREGAKVHTRTRANLSSLTPLQVDAIRRAHQGEKLGSL